MPEDKRHLEWTEQQVIQDAIDHHIGDDIKSMLEAEGEIFKAIKLKDLARCVARVISKKSDQQAA